MATDTQTATVPYTEIYPRRRSERDPQPCSSAAARPQEGGHRTQRLSPYLTARPSTKPREASGAPLLGRLRGSSSSSRDDTTWVVGPPRGLAPVRTTGIAPRSAAAWHESPQSDLVALSNLTLGSDSAATATAAMFSAAVADGAAELTSSSMSTSHPSMRSGSTSPTPLPTVHTAESGAAAAAAMAPTTDWRSAFRVPLFNIEGYLMGYRQNSDALAQQRAGSRSPPLAPLSPEATASPPHRASPEVSEEFAAAAVDPLKGFPHAEDVVPGYLLGPVLGKGGFCTVRKALHEATGLPVAFKIIEKERLADPKDRERVEREVRVMRQLSGHVAVARLLECVETQHCKYIVLEYCEGGSLLDHVRECKHLSERHSAVILQQLLHALQHCHSRGVVHRDVKLENVLLDGQGGVRLIDFGLCGYYVPEKKLRCHCGSPSYAAPEIVARKEYLGPPVDVWSLGVVLFAMLAGHLPFYAKDKTELSDRIKAGQFKVPSSMSPAAKDLLLKMLDVNPDTRATVADVKAHCWVAGAPRWEPPGYGPSGLQRAQTDPGTGALLPEGDVLETLAARGADVAAIIKALRAKECLRLTVAYHLLCDAKAKKAAGGAGSGHCLPYESTSSSMGSRTTSSGSSSGSGASSGTVMSR